MGENQSFDSSNSTLTQCIDSAAKRKRDCESDCDSFVSAASERRRSFESGSSLQPTLPMTTELHLLFEQLVIARFSFPPYQSFIGWRNEQLWHTIAKVLAEQDGYSSSSSVDDILDIVLKYYNHYAEDKLKRVKNESLRINMLLVYEGLNDTRGRLSCENIERVKDTISKSMARPLHAYDTFSYAVSADDTTGRDAIIAREQYKIVGGHGTAGRLSVQYMRDLSALQLTKEEKARFLVMYGPESSQYMATTLAETDDEKLLLLRALLDRASWSSSCKRNRV